MKIGEIWKHNKYYIELKITLLSEEFLREYKYGDAEIQKPKMTPVIGYEIIKMNYYSDKTIWRVGFTGTMPISIFIKNWKKVYE